MLSAPAKVYLYTQPTDMRKSFDGLIALTRNMIKLDPLSGYYFVFVNRNRDYFKILHYERGGYCLWCKRLEQGRFAIVSGHGDSVELSYTQLMMWIDGIALESRAQQKRYSKPSHSYPVV
ncbi:hypothetical protein AB833_20505 [Chromatiales bacterium (ex Bugula neritina AB1)]|nr:hypothetical protein AB833_20505 [Chromatiales bacterium (ex Bugula neritina AB1)]